MEIRRVTSGNLYRPEWPVIEIPDGHTLAPIYYNSALGELIARFNQTELYFKNIIGFVSGMNIKNIDAVTTHIGAGQLTQILDTLASVDSLPDEIGNELRFAGKLFDHNRLNRNFLTHAARPMFPGFRAMLATTRTARGKVQIKHYEIGVDLLRKTADEQIDAQEYFMNLAGQVISRDWGEVIQLPEQPKLPEKLSDLPQTKDILGIFAPSAGSTDI